MNHTIKGKPRWKSKARIEHEGRFAICYEFPISAAPRPVFKRHFIADARVPAMVSKVQEAQPFKSRREAEDAIIQLPAHVSARCDVLMVTLDCCSANHRATTPRAELFTCHACGFAFCGACEGTSDAHPDLCDECAANVAKAAA